jgi:hypothetical protein
MYMANIANKVDDDERLRIDRWRGLDAGAMKVEYSIQTSKANLTPSEYSEYSPFQKCYNDFSFQQAAETGCSAA